MRSMILEKYFSNVQNFRFERKFLAGRLTLKELELFLKRHPFMFREIYQERQVNNIYFDSSALRDYHANLNGETQRLKIRVRWYGNTFDPIDSPVLELKYKHNMHVTKRQYPISSFILDKGFKSETLKKSIAESIPSDMLRHSLSGLNCSLLNSYKRKYFISADHHYRITLDWDLAFYEMFPFMNAFLSPVLDQKECILEVKYNVQHDSAIERLTNEFPFRISRCSKYVTGISALSKSTNKSY